MSDLCSASYLTVPSEGRQFQCICEARLAILSAGEVIRVRDLGRVAPETAWRRTPTRGKWHLRPYELTDGSRGELLVVNDSAKEEGPRAVPPEFEIELDLPGWYAIWFGIPRMDLRPIMGTWTEGVDVALDNDPCFVQVSAERGTRRGRLMGPMDVEIMAYWKCARLDGRSLKVRVPYGTFISYPWGLVRGCLSSIQLVKLSDQQVEQYRRDIADPGTKRVIVVHDGFSHYWTAAAPGNGIDARFVQAYRDSDVKTLIFQTPCTGVSAWPSKMTSFLGEMVPPEKWTAMRKGDLRAYEYIRWAIGAGQEGMRVVSRLCRDAGLACQASMRLNLFFQNNVAYGGPMEGYINGRWWLEHPEARKRSGNPCQLDYSHPETRKFVLGILRELAADYDFGGINLDFTRWPPIADPVNHDFNVLTSFVREVRKALDEIGKAKNQRLTLSALLVEGFYARNGNRILTLEDQKIDFETWCERWLLDFVCVETCSKNHAYRLARAKRFGIPYYCINDQMAFDVAPDDWPRAFPEEEFVDDPHPGWELEEQPPVSSMLDPTEYDKGFLDRYRLGVDGVCLTNRFVGGDLSTRRLGHAEEMAERVKTGRIFGQEVGPSIRILP